MIVPDSSAKWSPSFAVHFIASNLEVLIWIAALVYLAIYNPYLRTDFTFCPLKNLGFTFCPGCGLGRSISFILHGDLISSFKTHVFGVPALVILIQRIITLVRSAAAKRISLNQS